MTPEPVRPEELPAAFRLLFQHADPAEREARTVNALRLVRRGELDPHGLFVVRGRRGLLGAVFCLPMPGAAPWSGRRSASSPARRRGRRPPPPRRRLASRPRSRWPRPCSPPTKPALPTPCRATASPTSPPSGSSGMTCPSPARIRARPPRLPALRPFRSHPVSPDPPAYLRRNAGLSGIERRARRGRCRGRPPGGGAVRPRSLVPGPGGRRSGRRPDADRIAGHGRLGSFLRRRRPRGAAAGIRPRTHAQGLFQGPRGGARRSLSVDGRNRPAWDLYLDLGFEPYDCREVFLAVWK